MGLSYAKESHAEFFNRFSICQDRIKDLFEIEKGNMQSVIFAFTKTIYI